MQKQTGLHAGTWAAKEGQVGIEAGRQENVGWQGQAEETGWPTEGGRQAGGRQAESLRQAGVEVGGQKEAGTRGRQAGKRDRVAQAGRGWKRGAGG
jgi:hypothetical protein